MTKKFYRLNQYISAETVRVVDEKGKQIGILSLKEALKKAKDLKADLVEVAPAANPPVCKIINFKKFLYLEAKKQQKEKKKIKKVEIKEIRLAPFIAEADLNFRLKRAEEFLKEGNKVKVKVLFKGRQIAKKEFGYELIKKCQERLNSLSRMEGQPKFLGNQLEVLFTPVKGEKNESKKA